jgi:hypothetical protein
MRSHIAICINNVAAQDLPITKNQLLYTISKPFVKTSGFFVTINPQIAIHKTQII